MKMKVMREFNSGRFVRDEEMDIRLGDTPITWVVYKFERRLPDSLLGEKNFQGVIFEVRFKKGEPAKINSAQFHMKVHDDFAPLFIELILSRIDALEEAFSLQFADDTPED